MDQIYMAIIGFCWLAIFGCRPSAELNRSNVASQQFLRLTLVEGNYSVSRLGRSKVSEQLRGLQVELYKAAKDYDGDLGSIDSITNLPVTYPNRISTNEYTYYDIVTRYKSRKLEPVDTFRAVAERKGNSVRFREDDSESLLKYIRFKPEQGIVKLDGRTYATGERVIKDSLTSEFDLGYSGIKFEYASPEGATLEDLQTAGEKHVEVNSIVVAEVDESDRIYIKIMLADYNGGTAIHSSNYLLKKMKDL